jgi:hypothetical protein
VIRDGMGRPRNWREHARNATSPAWSGSQASADVGVDFHADGDLDDAGRFPSHDVFYSGWVAHIEEAMDGLDVTLVLDCRVCCRISTSED